MSTLTYVDSGVRYIHIQTIISNSSYSENRIKGTITPHIGELELIIGRPFMYSKGKLLWETIELTKEAFLKYISYKRSNARDGKFIALVLSEFNKDENEIHGK